MSQEMWLTAQEDQAWRGLMRMQAQLVLRLNRRLQSDAGLSVPDYEVLVYLSEAEGGRLRVGELGDLLQWESSRLSHHLGRMQKRGLLSRESCSDDRRGFDVVLTPDGQTAIERAAPRHVEQVRRAFFDVLRDDQLSSLSELTDTVLAHLRDDDH
jgi:DNA-binding MarR family transcriptional regulator